MNDMPVGEFRGRPIKTAAGSAFRGQEFQGAHRGRNKRGQPTIFQRKGDARLPIAEAALDLKDCMDTFVEANIITEAEAIFWRHFERDLAARVAGFGLK